MADRPKIDWSKMHRVPAGMRELYEREYGDWQVTNPEDNGPTIIQSVSVLPPTRAATPSDVLGSDFLYL